MGIRIATESDIGHVYLLAVDAGESTGHGKYFDSKRLYEVVRDFINSPGKVIFLYEDKGMLAAMKTVFPFGLQSIATEISWWVQPEERLNGVGEALVKAFEEWAQQNDCAFVIMSCLDPGLGKYYEKLGYKLYVQDFIKELK